MDSRSKAGARLPALRSARHPGRHKATDGQGHSEPWMRRVPATVERRELKPTLGEGPSGTLEAVTGEQGGSQVSRCCLCHQS